MGGGGGRFPGMPGQGGMTGPPGAGSMGGGGRGRLGGQGMGAEGGIGTGGGFGGEVDTPVTVKPTTDTQILKISR